MLASLKTGHCPHRLVVRTSRRGRDNPGSTPGVDTFSYAIVAAIGHVHHVTARAAARNMSRQYGFASGIRSRRAAVAILELDHFHYKNVADS